MRVLNNLIKKYVFFTSPFALLTLVAAAVLEDRPLSTAGWETLWQVAQFNLLIWLMAVLCLISSLIFFENDRNRVLLKLAGIRERDERESFITGIASKSTFLSTIALLILLLFLSLIQLRIEALPTGGQGEGTDISLSLGIGFGSDEEAKSEEAAGEVLFDYNHLPLTQPVLLVLLILWQFAAYRYFAKRAAWVE